MRILVVDDHPSVRHGLRAMLEATPDLVVCGEADSVAAALRAGREQSPDIVLFDLKLPDNAGVHGLRRILDGLPSAQVVVLSGNADHGLVRDCLVAGAVGYLLKTLDSSRLCEALRQAGRGIRVIDPALVDVLVDAAPGALTPRELDVLEAVSQGLTNRQVANALGTKESTIKTLLARSMAKLEAADRAHAVAQGLRRGLIG